MNRVNLKDCQLRNKSGSELIIDELIVFLDDDNRILLLPLLFALNTARTGTVINWKRVQNRLGQDSVEEMERCFVTPSTVRTYMSCLFSFFQHLNDGSGSSGWPSVHDTFRCDESFVNTYLNETLPRTAKSIASLNVAKSSLTAYFNFLEYLEIRPRLRLTIFRKTKQLVAYQDDRPRKVSYISREQRSTLLRVCRSKCERLILRTGYELGLRSAENQGLRLFGDAGLLELFGRLASNRYENVQRFPYYLDGRFSKRGRSRWLYIDRTMLRDMRDYYLGERKVALRKSDNPKTDCLFVTGSKSDPGRPISARHASNVFAKRKREVPFIDTSSSYHDLRHTFATELYHAELASKGGRETRSESAALLVVSERLGHAPGRDGYASSSTARYIRLRDTMHYVEGLDSK